MIRHSSALLAVSFAVASATAQPPMPAQPPRKPPVGIPISKRPITPARSTPAVTLLPSELVKNPPPVWESEISAEFAEASCIATFRRDLWAATKSASGVELLRQRLTDEGPIGEPERMSVPTVPAGQNPAGLCWMPESATIWLATNPASDTGKPMLFSAPFSASGAPGDFAAVELPRELNRIASLATGGGLVALVGGAAAGSAPSLRVFAAPWTGGKLARWEFGNEYLESRGEFAAFILEGQLHVVGGGPDGGGMAELAESRNTLSASLAYPNIGTLRKGIFPLPAPVARTTGTAIGDFAIVLGTITAPLSGEADTSLTLMVTGARDEDRMGKWRLATMNSPARRGARVAFNQTDSQVLVVGGRDLEGMKLDTMAAFAAPRWGDAPIRKDAEPWDRDAKLARAAGGLPTWKDQQKVRDAAFKRGAYILSYFPGAGPTSEETTAEVGSSPSFRTMSAGAVVSRVNPDADNGLSSKLGVTSFPAFVLHTVDDKVLTKFEGGKPSNEDLFKLTAPTRDPPGTHPDPKGS